MARHLIQEFALFHIDIYIFLNKHMGINVISTLEVALYNMQLCGCERRKSN